MSSFPPLMRELAATCRTEWTCVVPLGTTLTVSSTERMLCVTMRPSAEILKLCGFGICSLHVILFDEQLSIYVLLSWRAAVQCVCVLRAAVVLLSWRAAVGVFAFCVLPLCS